MCQFPDYKDDGTENETNDILTDNVLNDPKHMIYLLYFAILIEALPSSVFFHAVLPGRMR